MRRTFFLSIVLCLVCLQAAKAQTNLSLNEAETRVVLQANAADFSIVLENAQKGFAGKITLELLDVDDTIRAVEDENKNIKSGRETYQISLPLSDLRQKSNDKIAWFRLHYRVADANNQTQAEGIVSLSEIIRDIFELHAAGAESVFAGMDYQVRVQARHPLTGAAITGVKINGEISSGIEPEKTNDKLKFTASGQTDAQGFAVLNFKIPADAELDDDGELKITGEKYGFVRETKSDLRTLSAENKVYLNTDKPLYQPGQNLNVRGLFFNEGITETNAVKDSELEFLIKDEDDTLLYRETVKTSRFGVAALRWQIPENAKLGTYRVEVKTDGGDVGSQSFKISRYDLPQFSVAAKADRDYYLPANEAADVTVSADYLFGKPVAAGKVKIVREAEREWNYREQKWNVKEEQTSAGDTDAAGKFKTRIDLTAQHEALSHRGYSRYEDLHFAAYFTDATTNRTEAKRFDIRISKEAIHVYLIGKTYSQNPKLPVTLYVSTFYADGTPAVCDVEIKGKYEKETAEKILARVKTNSYGAGKIEFDAPPNGNAEKRLELAVKASDAKKQTGTYTDESISFTTNDDLQIRAAKIIFRPNESVKAEIVSTKKQGLVYIDLVKDWTVISSQVVKLENNRAEIKFPFQPNFKGELVIAAYAENIDEDGNYETMTATRGMIFPQRNNLQLSADFAREIYRPNEEASINFNVLAPDKKPLESALGIVVFDKAIEERARADSDFGGSLNLFESFNGLLGLDKSFGNLSRRDLDEIDLSKSVSNDLQLVAEVMLYDIYYNPKIERSDAEDKQAFEIFAARFREQFAPVETALKNAYLKNYEHPTDDALLRKILGENNINFDELRDPWGNKFRAVFDIEEKLDTVNFESAGTDKKFDTKDDFVVSGLKFEYFLQTGKLIDKTIANYHTRTKLFVREEKTLRDELKKNEFDLNALRDRGNHPYRIEFGIEGRRYTIRFHSSGANGKFETENYDTDDFDVWTNATDYFAENENRIQKIISEYAKDKKYFPRDVENFTQLLKNNGVDAAQIKDGYGQNIYVTKNIYSRYADKVHLESVGTYGANASQKTTLEPVTQEVVSFKLRSKGADKIEGSEDDFDLTSFAVVTVEQGKDGAKKQVAIVPTTDEKGAISGTIKDPQGAVVPGAKVTATNSETEEEFSALANSEGFYLIENLPEGKYKMSAEAIGFMNTILNEVPVRAEAITDADFSLQVGGMAETVEVSSGVEVISTSTQYGYGSGNGSGNGDGVANKKEKNVADNKITNENSTPRLREYFPETLVWNPELITDKNGKAELKFKFGDNLTTWKLYAIASDLNGKIGITQKEIKTFQPFFADLEPPKILTVGDEINLPVQIRNYTEKAQKVSVTMEGGNWFSFLNSANQIIEVAPNNSQNAVFGFRAETAIEDGKQKVAAIADKDSDAIEKSVAVHPNGQEIVETQTALFRDAAAFDVNFPTDAQPKTQKAELKIYPNLLSHVAESVTGLLERPYGCGEQTISSTYPNLLILKFGKNTGVDEKLKAQAQKYLQKGYERLLGYQQADGGFSVWTKDEPDIALTAYAIRFLNDAKEFIAIDDDVIANSQKWLLMQQRTDGSWTRKYDWEKTEDASRTKILTTYIARILAMTERPKKEKSREAQNALAQAFAYLKNVNQEIDEPFAMASFALALLDGGDAEAAKPIIEKLQTMAITEGEGVYWNLETNTPFYGWGTAGRIETTALVVQALVKSRVENRNPKVEDLITRGTLFLLKNKDRYGVWYSTQTTVNVLDALLSQFADDKQTATNRAAEIFVDGKKFRDIQLPPSNVLANPLTIDLSGAIAPTANKIEVKINGNDSATMVQIISNYYVNWQPAQTDGKNTNQSRQIRLDYKCDKTSAAIMQEINCAVEAERVGFKGYGMLLAEIGLPPGADVDRASLEKARNENRNFSRYDILPDRIIVYLWAQAGGTKFNFKFKPRYAINASTAPSQIYDYYNSEAQAALAPVRFTVK